MRDRTREAARGERGRLNIANISALSQRILPTLLSKFRAKFPEIEVRLFEMQREQQLVALEEGRVRVALFPNISGFSGRRRRHEWFRR